MLRMDCQSSPAVCAVSIPGSAHGSTSSSTGSVSVIIGKPAPVGLPAEACPSLTSALPRSRGRRSHRRGRKRQTAMAASIAPALRRNRWEPIRRKGPQNSERNLR